MSDDRREPTGSRLQELDSLRGLAAFIVFTTHVIWAVPSFFAVGSLTPLFAGHEAVLLFFLLSGFVLSLPYWRGPVSLGAFLTKRICRLYPPYFVALGVAMTACVTRAMGPDGGSGPIGWPLLLYHLPLVTDLENCTRLCSPFWSLSIEMRISLVFPLLVGLLALGRLALVAVLTLLASVAAVFGTTWLRHQGIETDYLLTLHYAGAFVVGIALARHRDAVLRYWTTLPAAARVLGLTAGMELFFYAMRAADAHLVGSLAYLLGAWGALLGAAVIVVASLAPGRLRAVLTDFAPVRYLGRVSYSFYLFHYIVIQTFCCSFWTRFTPWTIPIAMLTVSLLIADLSYRLVEVPSIALGRRLAARWQHAPRVPVAEAA